jgi:hypothetical protein
MMQLSELTPAQQQRFLTVSSERNVPVDTLLEDFRPDLWMQQAIIGTLPHCGLFGLMEADGRCHT